MAVLVLAAVIGMLVATVVLTEIMDSAVEALRLRLLMKRDVLARQARRLRLPLVAMLPASVVGFLAGAVTESLLAGALTLGVTAGAMITTFLVVSR